MPLIDIKEIEDISPVFQGKPGNALAQALMRILCIDKINELYDSNLYYHGPDFAAAVLDDIGVSYEIVGSENLEKIPEGAFITISNHPYGSIDGIMLIDIFGHLRPDYKVMVNNFLGRIENLSENFIRVTPTLDERSVPSKESIQGIKDAVSHIRSGHPLGIFPSGAVSDLSLKERKIRDREWQEAVLKLIKKMRVPVVPVHFLDRNSDFYYSLGLIDWRVRLLRLPAEVFNKRGKRTRIAIGKIITLEIQDSFRDIGDLGKYLRDTVYNLH